MNADERIEKLLNEAHNTISDLPRRYDEGALNCAAKEAQKWYDNDENLDVSGIEVWPSNDIYLTYICYLADVIDRLEWALNNKLI